MVYVRFGARLLAAVLMLAVSYLVLTACSQSEQTAEEYLMGTYVTLKVYSPQAAVIEKTVERLREIENLMSANLPESEVGLINGAAGKSAVKISSDTFNVIETALYYSQLTNGAFDPTIGPLVNLWGIGTDKARIPSNKEIERSLRLVDYRTVILDKEQQSVKLPYAGQALDLGGIAKGYAADEAKRILKANGITSAIVNIGGNIMTLGTRPDGNPWRIGVQDPLGPRNSYIGIIQLIDETAVTSGNYERYFEIGGKRYHHILNPFTGYPSRSGLLSATIITKRSIAADALSTAVYVLGLDRGMELVESLPGIEAIFVTDDFKIYLTKGIIQRFDLTNPEYKVENSGQNK